MKSLSTFEQVNLRLPVSTNKQTRICQSTLIVFNSFLENQAKQTNRFSTSKESQITKHDTGDIRNIPQV